MAGSREGSPALPAGARGPTARLSSRAPAHARLYGPAPRHPSATSTTMTSTTTTCATTSELKRLKKVES